MKKINKREHSLYGIVYPCDMQALNKDLAKIANAISEIYSKNDPNRLVRVNFDFKKISKGNVYKFLISAAKLPNGLRCSERKLAVILAVFTNIADNPVCSKRVNTIRCNYKRYKKHYK